MKRMLTTLALGLLVSGLGAWMLAEANPACCAHTEAESLIMRATIQGLASR